MKAFNFYTQKALKSTLNIQKSPKKLLKALKKYSLYLLFSLFSGLFFAFINAVIVTLALFYVIIKSIV
jgi:hypothetical protein